METEQHHYELRSRSRSRSHTPMVLSNPLPEPDVTEHHYDLRNGSRERSHTPGEVTSSRRSTSRSLTSNKMHEKGMETIEENKEGSVTESLTDNQSTISEGSVVTTKKAERRSERQRLKKQKFASSQNEREDVSDEKSKQKRKSVKLHGTITSDYSSEEGEREDPPSRIGSAYEIYKQAGEWWNVFPKTDYTYSPTSQCRYEIAPGILAMPNMSRQPIHTYDENTISQISRNLSQASRRTTESGISDTDTADLKDTASLIHSSEDNNDMSHARTNSTRRATLYKKTHIEQYTSHKELIYSEPEYSSDFRLRYSPWANTSKLTGKYDATYVDSDAELEETLLSKSSIRINQNWRIVQWFTYFITFIVTCFRKTIGFFRTSEDRKRHYYHAQTYQSYKESKWRTLWQTLDRYTHNIYFFFARMLLFDTWLLSQFTGTRKWLQEKGPKILWITLLPLLLLFGGWCIAQYFTHLSVFKTLSNTTIQKLVPNIQQEEYKNKIEEIISNKMLKEDFISIANLVNRIEMLETKQTHQMEHLINITRIVEELKQDDVDSRKEYNDKIIDIENKLDINELTNIAHNELKVIKDDFERIRELYAELKSCCNANAESVSDQNIEKHVERILLSYFPHGISKEDLAKTMQNLFVFHNRKDHAALNAINTDDSNVHMSDEHIRKIVKEVLQIYDADKTGQVDYALESAGGQIVSTRCTQRYDIKSRAFSLLGFTLYYESNNPRTVIQGNPMQPGICWAFQDFPGYLLIQLRNIIYVTGFTLEHVPRSILPNENMSSAPKKFDVWGLTNENDFEPVMFGDYEFVNSDENLQYFPVQNTEINKPYEYVELRIHSNHGQLDYTCLYRFRVHGRPA